MANPVQMTSSGHQAAQPIFDESKFETRHLSKQSALSRVAPLSQIKSGLSAEETQNIAHIFIEAALAAGCVILAHYDRRTPIGSKKDGSPVSFADEEAEKLILQRLAHFLPHYPVIAEEAIARGHMPQIGDTFILVDPLDGTREFIAHNDAFTVNLALIENGLATVGVIYAPAAGKLWCAAGGCDLLQIEQTRSPMPIIAGSLPLNCRNTAAEQALQRESLIALRSRLHCDQRTEQFLAHLPICRQIDFGSSLKFCAIAEGVGDVYPRFSPTMEWDVAAGDAIVRAAGGCVLTADGQRLTYGKQHEGFRNPAFVAWGSEALFQHFGNAVDMSSKF